MKIYEVADRVTMQEAKELGLSSPPPFIGWMRPRFVKAIGTGEVREPKAGEWYLSGAVPEAYKAVKDVPAKFEIAKLVRVVERRYLELWKPGGK